MAGVDDELEAFWNKLLSRDPLQIHEVFDPLDAATRRQILSHLQRMASEEGWLDEQRESARAALKTIEAL
jgi:hypothetical protein